MYTRQEFGIRVRKLTRMRRLRMPISSFTRTWVANVVLLASEWREDLNKGRSHPPRERETAC